jgi:hypothetical protein
VSGAPIEGAWVVVALKHPAISTSAQPQFTVRFTNAHADYINYEQRNTKA